MNHWFTLHSLTAWFLLRAVLEEVMDPPMVKKIPATSLSRNMEPFQKAQLFSVVYKSVLFSKIEDRIVDGCIISS